ncbi:MAG: PHB depolymerase family esterase [Hyphomonadaceae bacterium]
MTRTLRTLTRFAAAVFVAALTFGSAQAQNTPRYDRALEMRGDEHDGVSRFVGVYVPASHQRGTPAPLIVALHGRFSSPQAFHALSGLAAVAEEHGAVLIYPETIGGFWNDGGHDILHRRGEAVDDAGFIDQAIDAAIDDYGIDPNRIYVVGYDGGANMAFSLVCSSRRHFAGVAGVSALLWDYQTAHCPNAPPTPLLMINGRRDEGLPVDGGDAPQNINARRLSTSETIAFWRNLDGCSAPSDTGNDDSQLFASCNGGSALAYVGVSGGNHDWFHSGPGYELNRQGVDATALLNTFFFDRAHFALPNPHSSGSRSRAWIAYAPPDYDPARPTPVVVLLHGRPSNAISMAAISGMNDTAAQHNFIVVYPEGLDNEWNAHFDQAGRSISLSGQRSSHPQDDVGFLKTLMDDLAVDFNIDRSRLYVGGFSNGGFMTHRMACSAGDTFAAFAEVGSALYIELTRLCQRSPPTPMLFMHGSGDPSVPIDGVEIVNPQGGEPIRITLSVQDSVAAIARRNHCSMSGTSTTFAESGRSPGTQVVRFEPHGCDEGADIVYYLINGGGHTWPGAEGVMPEEFFGPTNMDFRASDAIWDFFSAHTLERRGHH